MKKKLALNNAQKKCYALGKGDTMDWFKQHADTAVVIGAIAASLCWMNASINELRDELRTDIARLDKDLAIVKTVLIMQKMMPCEMAHEAQDGR